MDGEILRVRRRIGYNGAAVATLVLDRKGNMRDEPQVSLPGLLDGMEEDAEIFDDISDAIEDAVAGLAPKARRDDESVIEAARRAVRRVVRARLGGRRPVTQIHVVRV
jgi:ribonuclease J